VQLLLSLALRPEYSFSKSVGDSVLSQNAKNRIGGIDRESTLRWLYSAGDSSAWRTKPMKRRNFLAGAISSVAMSRAVAQTSVDNRRLAIFSLSEPIALMHERTKTVTFVVHDDPVLMQLCRYAPVPYRGNSAQISVICPMSRARKMPPPTPHALPARARSATRPCARLCREFRCQS
jgi:hypothetical protein